MERTGPVRAAPAEQLYDETPSVQSDDEPMYDGTSNVQPGEHLPKAIMSTPMCTMCTIPMI